MIWQNPWAFAGLAALALPVLIHLLSRKQASLQKFPTLRFLDVSRLLPTRSPRITDVLLLIVRASVLAFAVFALAGPLFASASRTRSANAKVARAIIVETNGNQSLSDSLQARTLQFVQSSNASTVLPTVRVAYELDGAEAWLRLQSGRGEIVILSDFRASSIDSATLAAIPKEFGVKLQRLSPAATPRDTALGVFQSVAASVRVTAERSKTFGEWNSVSTSPNADSNALILYASAREKDEAESIRASVVQAIGAAKADTAERIALVYPGSSDTTSIVGGAKPLSKAWTANFLAKLQANAHFHAALAASDVATDTSFSRPFITLGRNAANAVVFATQISLNGHDALALFVRAQPASATSAELIAAIAQSQGEHWRTAELEPNRLSDATLAALQREPGVPATNASRRDYANANESDACWFWLVALVLLGVEAWFRTRVEQRAPSVEAPL